MAQVALAWVCCPSTSSPAPSSATKPRHLTDAVAALDVHVTAEEIAALEVPYTTQDHLMMVTT